MPSSNFPRLGWPHPQALGGSPRTGHGQWRPVWVRSSTAGSERHAVGAGAAPLRGCGAGGSGANPGGSPTAPATGSAQSRCQAGRSLCCRQRARAAGRGSPYLLVDEAVEEADQQALSNKAYVRDWGQAYEHLFKSSGPCQAPDHLGCHRPGSRLLQAPPRLPAPRLSSPVC